MRLQAQDHLVKEIIFFLLVLFTVSACEEQKQSGIPEQKVKTEFAPPVVHVLDTMPPPKRVNLNDAPPARVVTVPKTSGGSYIIKTEEGSEKIPLSPPEVSIASEPVPFFKNFNVDQGLANNWVTCSWQDPRGNLWFGTMGGGASCFNGKGFVNYHVDQGLSHERVRSIMGDNNGNIWFGTEGGGVCRYDGVGFKTYTTRDGLADSLVLTILNDKKGMLWFGTVKGGISRFDGNTFSTIDTSDGLPVNNINILFEDRKGIIWIGTYGGGVCRYDPEDGIKYMKTYTTRHGLANDFIETISEDTDGNIWFGTQSGACRFDGNAFTNFTKEQGLADNWVVSIMQDVQGNIWMGTYGGGLSRFDGKGFVNFKKKDGLADDYIFNIIKDKQSDLWFGTIINGLSCYTGTAFTTYSSTNSVFSNLVFNIVQDSTGTLWFAQLNKGAIKYDGKLFTTFTNSQGLGDNRVQAIAISTNGDLWFGTINGGLSNYDGKQFITYTTAQGLAHNLVECLLEDSQGDLWIGTFGGGVSRFDTLDGKAGFTTYTSRQGLAHDEVRSIAEGPDGNIWFGTDGGGVSRFDGKKFTNYNTGNGLAKDDISKIKVDRSGNLWFASSGGGLSRFDGSGFTSFSTREGLADDIVLDIVEDKDGVLWIGTNKGFSGLKFKVPKQRSNDVQLKGAGLLKVSNEILKTYEPAWEIYNSKTGYPIKDVNPGMMMTKQALPFGSKEDVGSIWAGLGDSRVIKFDPKELKKNTEPPVAFIHAVKIDESAINWYGLGRIGNDSTIAIQQEAMVFGRILPLKTRDSLQKRFSDIRFDSIFPFYQVPQNLVLPYRHNRFTIEYGTIEMQRPLMVRYQYILEGYDEEWSPVTEKTSATFGNISEGSYTFKLKAMSPEGVWSEPIAYSFRVLPPWWRSWWAYVIYAFSIMVSIAAIVRWRTRNLLHQRSQLEEKISQRTQQLELKSSELERSLNNLRATQAQLVQSEKMASLGELTAGIAHEIQNPLNFVNNFSQVNTELIEELQDELKAGNINEAIIIIGDLKENENKINFHGKRADSIVKGMLQHSRTFTGQKETTNINALADEYLRLAYQGMRAKDKNFNTTLETDFDETIGQINIIPQDIGRVLLNLYNNAFYAVTEKQKLSIEGYQPTVTVRTKKLNGEVEITVADNGNGISEKVLDKVFQPFFTTKPTGQGTGLGLSLSYDVIKAHQGKISIKNSPGMGVEFIISIPMDLINIQQLPA